MLKARVTTVLVLLALAAAAQRAAGQQADAHVLYRLSLPEKTWGLDLDLTAFNLPEGAGDPVVANSSKGRKVRAAAPVESLSADGTDYQLAAFRRLEGENDVWSPAGLLIRMMPSRAGVGTGAEALRAFKLKHVGDGTLRVTGVKAWEYKQIPVARFSADLSNHLAYTLGGPMITAVPKLRTLEAYFVKDDVWITVGLLASDIGEREEKLFYSVLDSIKFADTSAPSTSFDYFHKGRLLFLSKDYEGAARTLATALDMERRERRLDLATWRELVSRLMYAYGASGDSAHAKKVMDYGVASDPSNPTFQLALAHYAARLGDLDKTVEYLDKAFRLHVASGQPGPLYDPMRDRSFEQFSKDERFRKAVKAMMKY